MYISFYWYIIKNDKHLFNICYQTDTVQSADLEINEMREISVTMELTF